MDEKTKYLILGDVHGQYDRLQEILDEHFDKAEKVIFLGDYIDKNKKSLKTLEYILDRKEKYPKKVELIWGNHDIFMLNSVLYNDERLFYTWFYLNNAYKTTLFDYVPGNDSVLFNDGYDEFIAEYHNKIGNDLFIIDMSKRLLQQGKLFYIDEKIFCIHGGIPINIVRRNDFKFIDFYKGGGIEGLKI